MFTTKESLKRALAEYSEDKDLNRYQMSAIVGLYRQGNCDAVICAVIGCKLSDVFGTIKLYRSITENN